MERVNQGGGTAFWWRAAEPIPARPLPLDARVNDEIVATAPFEQQPLGARPAALRPSEPRGYANLAGKRGLTPPVAVPAGAEAPPAYRPHRVGGLPRRRAPIASGLGSRHGAFAAAGVIVLAGLGAFGAQVRGAPPMLAQARSWAIASGFGINEISVAGLQHTSDSDVFRVLGPTNTTLVGLDVAAARARIEALPWVQTATIVRILPDKLRIEIRERRASAVWLQGERTSLVDASGRLLGHLGSFVPPDLPRIAGTGAPEAAADLFAALGQHVGLRSRVVLARRIGERRWDLELASGTRVKLAAADLAASLVRLVALQQESQPTEAGILDRANQIIDLTLDDRIAIGVDTTERTPMSQAAVRSDPAHPL